MRIASLSPAITEILYALDLQKQIVVTDKFSDFPEDAKSLPHLKDHQKLQVSDLEPFKPEIVFTETLVQAKVAKALESDDWKVIHLDPRSLFDIYDSIRTIGLLFEASGNATALIEKMRKDFNDTKKKASLLPKKLKVYVEEWHNPPMVSGNWVPEIVKLAGGIPFSLETNAPSREVSLTEIQAFNPDLIVLSICGAGSLAEKKLITGRKDWNAIPAVISGNIKVIDDSLLNRPGPRLTEGAKRLYSWIFERLHS